VSKKKKRLERMRINKRNVSYSDFIAVLGDYAYSWRSGKGSHRVATVNLEAKTLTLTFVEPHEGKFMHHKDVERLLKQINEIEAISDTEEENDDE
jgi:hypothetical protein